MKQLTFIEVRSDAVDRCRIILREYVSAVHQPATAQSVRVLEEIGRPERFVLLESAADLAASAGRHTLEERLGALLTAPPDRRAHRELGDSTVSKPDAQTSSSLYVIAHLDVAPLERSKGETALLHLASEARRSQGNLAFELWQQTDRANHFNLIAVWNSRAKFDDFTAGTAAREFRKSVASLLGSPYDERLYRRAD
jgi:quinol monooxygenase YgiN